MTEGRIALVALAASLWSFSAAFRHLLKPGRLDDYPPDLKKWVAAIDLTADRAGFLLAHDLQTATEVMRATEDGASIASKERMKEVVLFSVGEDYFGLREKLQIALDS